MQLDSKRSFSNTYTIFTNYTCNLNCTYCFEHNKMNLVNDTASIKNFIQYAYKHDMEETNYNKDQVLKFYLIGGEPLLVPNIISCICDEAYSLQKKYHLNHNFKVYITTNGTLINTPEIKKLFKKYKDYIKIGVSIDGNKESNDKYRVDYNGMGSWDRGVEGIKIALDILGTNLSKVSCKSTYTHDNIPLWSEGVISLLKLGVNWINANYVTEEIWTDEDTPILADQFFTVTDYLFNNNLYDSARVMQCNKYPNRFMVNYDVTYIQNKSTSLCKTPLYPKCLGFDNKIYPCHRFITENDDKYALGILKDNEIVITNDLLQKNIHCIYENLPDKCITCKLRSECYRCSEYLFQKNIDNPSKVLKETLPPMCGWVTAEVASRYYFKRRLRVELGIPEDSPDNIKLIKNKSEVNSNSLNT